MPLHVLSMGPLPQVEAALQGSEFVLHHIAHCERHSPGALDIGDRVEVLIACPLFGAVDAELLAGLPRLRAIVNRGIGVDHIDLDAARRRGIVVSHTPDAGVEDVADLAFGLLLDAVRGISANDRWVRSGAWPANGKGPRPRRFTGKRLGLLGFGRIGQAIARRATGFDLAVSYHARAARTDVPYRFVASVIELASTSDFLVVAVAANGETRHLVDRKVLRALGRDGVLINVSRGSVVDEDALMLALQTGEIAAAGLDVFANEPHVPAAFFAHDRIVLQSHRGSYTQESHADLDAMVVQNIRAFQRDGEVVHAAAHVA